MTDALDIPRFLDRRLNPKGNAVTETKARKAKQAVLRLVVEYDHETFDMEEVKALVEKAREQGAVRSAKLSGLPSTSDLS
jgi:hypothetical protein